MFGLSEITVRVVWGTPLLPIIGFPVWETGFGDTIRLITESGGFFLGGIRDLGHACTGMYRFFEVSAVL